MLTINRYTNSMRQLEFQLKMWKMFFALNIAVNF